MMLREHIRMASDSIRSSHLRSIMTMFGIIVGVTSVTTVFGLGQGLRNQVTHQVAKLGSNLIIVLPGKQMDSSVINFARLQNLGTMPRGIVTEQDLAAIAKKPQVQQIAPVATINGLPSLDDRVQKDAIVVGTTDSLAAILGKKIEYGTFLSKDSLRKNYAVIGQDVAEQLFKENVPIGKSFQIKQIEFIVQGVFEQTPATPLSPSINFNKTVVIGFDKAKEISDGSLQINQILVTTKDSSVTAQTAQDIKKTLLQDHGQQEDFSVLRQQETLAVSDNIFRQLTTFITWAAIISLLVGGIGIMNVMFANVSERTREIGIRKALGATNRQIISQFLTEAIILSLTGGGIGVILSLIILGALRATTSFEPAVSLPAIGVSTGISVAVGIVSGFLPAIKAAKKDPIESLRR